MRPVRGITAGVVVVGAASLSELGRLVALVLALTFRWSWTLRVWLLVLVTLALVAAGALIIVRHSVASLGDGGR